ncbi:ACT domain-containing protein [bacterium]|nr:ACT domain-containing protein [bacterium]
MGTQKEEYRTTIVFSLRDKPGALCDALKPFKKYNINLTRIISRPHTKKEWQYIFFIEIEGREENLRIKKALKGLRIHTISVYVLGSYPLRKV